MTPSELAFFKEILSIDSTTGKERALSDFLAARFVAMGAQVSEDRGWAASTPYLAERSLSSGENGAAVLRRFEVGDGTENLLLSWGEPKVVFCTHMDTVPPYILPTISGDGIIHGRGACDAKGQIVAMFGACLRLVEEGKSDFALLLLSGEETGSWGAKAFSKTSFSAPFLIIGEPTDGIPVSASKGTKSFDLTFHGVPFHSGYPEHGVSAIDLFNDFYNRLKAVDFGDDPVLGNTTWNIGLLKSDNPQNILSGELTCRIYFRTTFVSDDKVESVLKEIAGKIDIIPRGGDAPARYVVPEGFPSKPAAFGSDAPHLTNFPHKIICGPGSILTAHRDNEQITTAEIDKAIDTYISFYNHLSLVTESI